MTLTDYINKIKKTIKDNSSYLSNDDILLCIENGLAKLSKDWPLIVDVSCSGNNGSEYNLPAEWVEGFSFIQAMEYPVGNLIPEYLEEEDYEIYQNNNQKMIRFTKTRILSTEQYKIFFAVPYKIASEENNVPTSISKAVIFLASFFACEMLSAKYSNFQSPDINSGMVNFNSQAEKIKKVGANCLALYENLVFNKSCELNGDYELKPVLINKSYSSPLLNNKMFHTEDLC
jgi:hypothetical protein